MTNNILYDILNNKDIMDIKGLRIRLGLTQDELAHRLGVSWSTIARWEAGKGKPSKLAKRAIEELIEKEKVGRVDSYELD